MSESECEIKSNSANLFNESGFVCNHNGYSSTKYSEILTTIFKLFGSAYCIHCGDGAKPVQYTIDHGRSHGFSSYEDAGHRCNCVGALDEAAHNAALGLGTFNNWSKRREYNVDDIPSEIFLKIINGRDNIQLSRLINKSSYVIDGSVNMHKFMRENSGDIKMYTKGTKGTGDYYEEHALNIFMKNVEQHYNTLVEQTKEINTNNMNYLLKEQKRLFGQNG